RRRQSGATFPSARGSSTALCKRKWRWCFRRFRAENSPEIGSAKRRVAANVTRNCSRNLRAIQSKRWGLAFAALWLGRRKRNRLGATTKSNEPVFFPIVPRENVQGATGSGAIWLRHCVPL